MMKWRSPVRLGSSVHQRGPAAAFPSVFSFPGGDHKRAWYRIKQRTDSTARGVRAFMQE
jgi:hypothetical protein